MSNALRIQNLHLKAGETSLLQEVNLTLHPGEFVALVGPNGAGKSSLLKCILGLRRAHDGEITINDIPVTSHNGRQRAAQLGWLPQHGLVREAVPVVELVIAARFRFDEGRAAALEAAEAALTKVDATPLRNRSVLSLSGGESQRVALAVLIAQESNYLLLDEPANHLDPAQQRQTYSRLGDSWRDGKALLCVTHDVNLLGAMHRPTPDTPIRVVGLGLGRLAFDSHYDDPELPNHLSALFGVPFSAIQHGGRRHLLITEETQ